MAGRHQSKRPNSMRLSTPTPTTKATMRAMAYQPMGSPKKFDEGSTWADHALRPRRQAAFASPDASPRSRSGVGGGHALAANAPTPGVAALSGPLAPVPRR